MAVAYLESQDTVTFTVLPVVPPPARLRVRCTFKAQPVEGVRVWLVRRDVDEGGVWEAETDAEGYADTWNFKRIVELLPGMAGIVAAIEYIFPWIVEQAAITQGAYTVMASKDIPEGYLSGNLHQATAPGEYTLQLFFSQLPPPVRLRIETKDPLTSALVSMALATLDYTLALLEPITKVDLLRYDIREGRRYVEVELAVHPPGSPLPLWIPVAILMALIAVLWALGIITWALLVAAPVVIPWLLIATVAAAGAVGIAAYYALKPRRR